MCLKINLRMVKKNGKKDKTSTQDLLRLSQDNLKSIYESDPNKS